MYKKTSTLSARPQAVPAELRKWLYAQGSLTQQLTQLAHGQFQVKPTYEGFSKVSMRDSRWMSTPVAHLAWVRESFLYGAGDEPWVKAKSIFPMVSIQKRARLFRFIGTQPIGRFLFDRTTPYCERRVIHLSEGWTRQSCYCWHDCKFIVQETFLPAFEAYIQQ